MRSVALDVHLDFCEVAIVEGERFAPRVGSRPSRSGLSCSLQALAQMIEWRSR